LEIFGIFDQKIPIWLHPSLGEENRNDERWKTDGKNGKI